MSKEVYLYGASGHALVVSNILGEDVRSIYIDDIKSGAEFDGQIVQSPGILSWDDRVLISIGDNKIRRKIADNLSCRFISAISRFAVVAPSAEVGEGTVVMQGAIIQPKVVIGKHCIVNTAATIDHESKVDDFVHISPGAILCGNVVVGEGTWIGAGAVVVQGVKIGRWCVIAAGSVVLGDVLDGTMVAGIPAEVKRRYNNEVE